MRKVVGGKSSVAAAALAKEVGHVHDTTRYEIARPAQAAALASATTRKHKRRTKRKREIYQHRRHAGRGGKTEGLKKLGRETYNQGLKKSTRKQQQEQSAYTSTTHPSTQCMYRHILPVPLRSPLYITDSATRYGNERAPAPPPPPPPSTASTASRPLPSLRVPLNRVQRRCTAPAPAPHPLGDKA